jgi:hypothetical protein
MATLVYNSFLLDESQGNVRLFSDTFYALVYPSTYTPNARTHTRRSDVTEISGTNYPAGGVQVTPTITLDNDNDRVNVTWSGFTLANVTLTNAAGVAVYKRRGGLASADELVGAHDFDIVRTVTATDLIVASFVMRKTRT